MYTATIRQEMYPVADADADHFFADTLEGTLPGFIFDTAGASRAIIVARFAPIAEARGFEFRDIDEQVTISDTFELGENSEPEREIAVLNDGTSDFLPHIDFPMQPQGPKVSVVNLNLTVGGSADLSLFKLHPDLDHGKATGLPYGTSVELTNGNADPSVINPIFHGAVLRAGHMAVFRTGGHSPLVHYFKTIQSPRNAFVMRVIHRDGLALVRDKLPWADYN